MGNKQGQAGYQQFDDKKRKKSDPKWEKYDPDRIPANLQLALDHQNSRRIGDEKETPKGQQVNICDCCGYNVDREIMDINCNTNDLSFLGSGYPLFFDYIRYCIYILVIIFVISGVFNLVTNTMASDCLSYDDIQRQAKKNNPLLGSQALYKLVMKKSMNPKICVESFYMNLSLANKKDHEGLLKVQGILNFIVILVIIGFLQLMRRSQRQLETIADEKNISPTDFSVMVKHIENDKEGIDYDDQMKKLFQSKGIPGRSAHVKKVNLCFDLDEIHEFTKQKNELIAKKQKGLKEQISSGKWPTDMDPLEKIDKEIKELYKKIDKLEEEMRNGKTAKFCGVAFVSFNTEQEKTDVLQHNQITWMQRLKQALGKKLTEEELKASKAKNPDQHDLVWEGRKLVIEEAPEPSDVNWEYQGVASTRKQIKRVISLLITVGLLLLSFVSILYLNGQQRWYLQHKKEYPTRAKYIGTLISIIIIIINSLLNIFIKKLAVFENFSTQTRYNISIATKNVYAVFFNSALILFLVAYIYDKNVIGKGGLVENVSGLFFMSFIIKCIEESLCVGYYIKVAQQYFTAKEFTVPDGQHPKSVLTQQQLNTVFESPQFDIASKYAVIASLMFFTAFYTAIIPLGLVFAILELIALYWILKYNLLRRSMVQFCIGAELSRELTELIEYIVVINAVANFIFYVILHQGKITFNFFTLLTALGLIIGLINAFLPMKEINEKLFEVKGADDLKMNYDEAENKFDTDYDRENPATKTLANEEYRKRRENAHKHKGFF